MADLENELLSDISNVSLLKQLVEKLHAESQTKKMKTVESLCKVFEEYRSSQVLSLKNSITEYLWNIFDQVVQTCIEGLTADEEKFQAAWGLVLLRLLKIKYDSENINKSQAFDELVSKLLSGSLKVLSFLIREFEDLALNIIQGIHSYLLQNFLMAETFLMVSKALPSFEKVKKQRFWNEFEEKLPKKRVRVENFDPEIKESKVLVDTESFEYRYKEVISRIWITVLAKPLKESETKLFLKYLPKSAFQQVSNPLVFSDFFLRSFDLGDTFSMLSLNGLFVLSTKYGLEPKLYYNKLFSLLKLRLKKGKTMKPGFLRLVELSLSSHLLPAALVASFIRLFLKESLRSSTEFTLWTLVLSLKCLKTHPALAKMLHNESVEDHFDLNVNDPLLTKALESSLWEIQVLKHHWSPQIVEVVKEFEKNIEKIPRMAPSEVELFRNSVRAETQVKNFEEIF
jgi:hypothetical protein